MLSIEKLKRANWNQGEKTSNFRFKDIEKHKQYQI